LYFPLNYVLVTVLKTYLDSRHFPVKVDTEYTDLSLNAGVPQGIVLRPSLYLLHPVDLPTSPESFDDDTAVIQPLLQRKLQTNLAVIQTGLRWRIKGKGFK
jgi:hypothetical protein